jgi:hypothetical protein
MAKPRTIARVEDVVIGAVSRVREEQVRVSMRRSQGRKVLDLRIWVQDDLGKWIPTGRGMSLGPKDWIKLKEILGKLRSEKVGRAEGGASTQP